MNTLPSAGSFNIPFKAALSFRQNRLPGYFPVGADYAWPYTTPMSPPPSNEVVQEKLKTSHALAIGTQYGATFGALAGLPIYALEQAYKKKNFYSETLYPYFPRLSRKLAKPAYNLIASLAGTVFVGGTMGFFLGWMLVGDVRKRLLEINAVNQAQGQGIYNDHPPNLLSRLRIHPKPVDDPQQAYYDLVQNSLNAQNAFWHGVLTILVLKFVKGIALPVGAFSLATPGLRLLGYPKAADWLVEETHKAAHHWLQPVVIAKLALAPLMAGLIAEQLAPWMKRKLDITN